MTEENNAAPGETPGRRWLLFAIYGGMAAFLGRFPLKSGSGFGDFNLRKISDFMI